MNKQYETVIGLEVHVELATRTKIFCACSTAFGGAPNTHTCPVCTGMPGSLPVLNRKVVEYAVAVGLATNCEIAAFSKFDRKNYFYPDNPQNYQISQLYLPICRKGSVVIATPEGKKTIGIHEIHMEEDAGKMIHDEVSGNSLVDYNRSGVPLIEIVSEPDMRNAEEVIAYLEQLCTTIQYLGASDCKLNEGSMRVDVNLSVRPVGQERLGTRTEMKNLNSFRSITRAIAHEEKRQIEILEQGGDVEQETRRWDEHGDTSFSMRSKEAARDYRYFPEPDLVPVCITTGYLEQIKKGLPEFRAEKMSRYRKVYDLPEYDIEMITRSRYLADFFEATVAICKQPKKVANWLMGEILRLLREKGKEPEELCISPIHLAELIRLADEKVITGAVAKEIFAVMFEEDISPEAYAEEKGLKTVTDEGSLRRVVQEVLSSNQKSVSDYLSGKEKAIGFLVGQTMKAMQGKADPEIIKELLKELLQKIH